MIEFRLSHRRGDVVNKVVVIDDLIANGGFGSVYRAHSQLDGRRVALKEFSAQGLSLNDHRALLGLFQREGDLLNKLNHPLIPDGEYFSTPGPFSVCSRCGLAKDLSSPPCDCGAPTREVPSRHYVVMKFIEGESLEGLAKRSGRLDHSRVLPLMIDVADALRCLHEQKLLHLDVNPRNIICEQSTGRAYLIDFGSTEEMKGAQGTVVMNKPVVRTAGYAADEQREQQPAYISDIYALGMTCYRLVSGLDPSNSKDLADMRMAAPRQINPSIGVDVEEFILRAIRLRPPQFGTMSETLETLRSIATSKDAPASPAGVTQALRGVLGWIGPRMRPLGASVVAMGAALAGMMLILGRQPTTKPSTAISPPPSVVAPVASSAPSRAPSAAAALPSMPQPEASSAQTPSPPSQPSPASAALEPPEMTNPVDASVLVRVHGGSFVMGSNQGKQDEAPAHKVILRPYWIGKYEVSWKQYFRYCSASGHPMPSKPSYKPNEEHPVTNVSWEEAMGYCRWAGLRLPSEAEWEFAARGTESSTYPWGDAKPDEDRARFGEMTESTLPVGSIEGGKSTVGCYDLAGNVWEWCADWYSPRYYEDSASTSHEGPLEGTRRVIRGGSFGYGAYFLRCTNRDSKLPSKRGLDVGFRVAK